MPVDGPEIMATERVAIVGHTGSGKSYGALALLATCPRLVVCNVKGELPAPPKGWPPRWGLLPEKEAERGLRLLEQGKPARVCLGPRLAGEWNGIFHRLFRLRGVIIYLDEVIGTGSPGGTDGLDLLLSQGRGLGIGVWCATQRPARINSLILTQADWILGFWVQGLADKDRMAESMDLAEYPLLQMYDFLLYHAKSRQPPVLRRIIT